MQYILSWLPRIVETVCQGLVFTYVNTVRFLIVECKEKITRYLVLGGLVSFTGKPWPGGAREHNQIDFVKRLGNVLFFILLIYRGQESNRL